MNTPRHVRTRNNNPRLGWQCCWTGALVGHVTAFLLLPLALQAGQDRPQGKIVYGVEPNQIRILDTISGTTTTVPVECVTGFVGEPYVSPDGQWMTFYGGVTHNGQIYRVAVDGSICTNLTSGGGAWVSPSISPDGSQIAFQELYGDVYTIGADGSNLTHYAVQLGMLRWSPDGQKLVGSDWGFSPDWYQSDIFIFDLATQTLTNITHHQPGEAFIRPSWSPDGSKLALARRATGGSPWDIGVMNTDGSGRTNLTADWAASNEQNPFWSPDGEWILFDSDHDGNWDIWAMRPDGSNRTNLTSSAEVEYLPTMPLIPAIAVQPVSQTVVSGRPALLSVTAYGAAPLRYQWKLNGADIPGATTATLVLDAAQVRNTGSYWVLVSNKAGSVNSVTADLKVIPPTPQGIIVHGVQSPSQIRMLDTISGTTTTVPVACVSDPLEPYVSPNGQWFAFYGPDGQIYRIGVDGTKCTNLTSGGGVWVSPSISPDGSQIAFQELYGDVHTIGADGSNLTHYAVQLGMLRWSPDGQKLAGSDWGFSPDSDQSDIFIFDFVTQTLTNITQHRPGEAFIRPSWSPDGSKLALARRATESSPWDIWVMNTDGSGRTNLTEDWAASNEQNPFWSPDGEWILFDSDHDGNGDIWAMRPDGSHRTNLTSSAEVESLPTMPLVPVIAAQPVSQMVSGGQTASFTATVTGSRPFTHQWQFNGADIPGANSATLRLTGVTPDQVGTYRVIVRNAAGEVTSAEAVLTLFGITREVPVLRIDGFVGRIYRIEYRNAVDDSSSWQTLTTITLPTTPYYHMDISAVGQPKRFYQAILMP